MKHYFLIKFLALVLVALLLGLCLLIFKPQELKETSYTVKYGDCLWDIAEEHCPNNMDIRDYIYLVITKNNLDNITLQAGQSLTIFLPQE